MINNTIFIWFLHRFVPVKRSVAVNGGDLKHILLEKQNKKNKFNIFRDIHKLSRKSITPSMPVENS